jgi:hypothetical protein
VAFLCKAMGVEADTRPAPTVIGGRDTLTGLSPFSEIKMIGPSSGPGQTILASMHLLQAGLPRSHYLTPSVS